MTETKSPRNDFVSVLCKHDANCNIRAGLTSSRSPVNGGLQSLCNSFKNSSSCKHGQTVGKYHVYMVRSQVQSLELKLGKIMQHCCLCLILRSFK